MSTVTIKLNCYLPLTQDQSDTLVAVMQEHLFNEGIANQMIEFKEEIDVDPNPFEEKPLELLENWENMPNHVDQIIADFLFGDEKYYKRKFDEIRAQHEEFKEIDKRFKLE